MSNQLLPINFGAAVEITNLWSRFEELFLYNVKRWWNGEISGRRCAKNIIDTTAARFTKISVVMVFGLITGGLAGVVIGAIVGWVLQALVFTGTSFLTRKFFDLPQSEAVEEAYRVLGARPSTSDADLRAIYRARALIAHPDRGGDKEHFSILSTAMALIRVDRED